MKIGNSSSGSESSGAIGTDDCSGVGVSIGCASVTASVVGCSHSCFESSIGADGVCGSESSGAGAIAIANCSG